MFPPLMRIALTLFLAAFSACPALAQEFYVLGGLMEDAHSIKSSYSWQLEYAQGLGEHSAFTVSYLNEGHIPDHHRDGQSLQLWARTTLLDRRLSLAAGAGPYYYFDTTAAKEGASYSNSHGWKAMFSATATWRTESPWLFQVRSNWVTAGSSNDSFSTLFGIGYLLDPSPSPAEAPATEPAQQEERTRNEMTLFLGRTILNSYASEHSVAASIEYRRGLWKHVDWTAAWLHEGDTTQLRRDGFTTQLWAVHEGLDGRVTLGIGGGGYLAVSRRTNPDQQDEPLSGIVTLTGSYRFGPHWVARTSWNRIVTNYNRDTDVILGGIGYRF